MESILGTSTGSRSVTRVSIFVFICLMAVAVSPPVYAVQLKAARVTQVIKDVKLLGAQGAQRSAAISDDVREGTAVRTGTDSRAELTFTDLTITRLGADTVFSFNAGARQLDLGGGAVLVEVPRNAAAVKINTAAVTAAITGGTALFEYHKGMPAKLLILEGKGQFCSKIHPDECVTVGPGEMAMMTIDGRINQPTKFNAKTVMSTSKLIVGFAPLANENLILEVIEQQQADQSEATSNPPPAKDSTSEIDERSTATTAMTLAGSGAKFGPPSAILGNPYQITKGTQINTDPTITTNGITDFGKIYRSEAQDGPFAAWLGTTQSSFDNVNFFDSNSSGFQPGNGGGNSSNSLPLAGFLFSALDLNGNPTVSDPNGVQLLGFASQGGISATAAGTTFTFGGANEVGFIALNGSIDFSNASFANFGRLFIYARGAGSNLTLGSEAASISNVNRVEVRAEGNIEINGPVSVNGTTQDNRGFKALAGNNIDVNAPVTSASGGILLQSLGGITLTSSSQLLSMLGAMGTSGQVVVLASGSETTVNVSGTIQADQGEVDIRQTGGGGQTTLNNAIIHGDVVKVSALGNNGSLNIGSGNAISADSVIKLYAVGSNGTLNFLSNVTLTSPSNILAANTINISQGAVVTIANQANTKADVFTNNPHYFGFGGNAASPATAGTFAGAGANNPQPLANAPPLGAPGAGP